MAVCILCGLRVSEWQIASGKTVSVHHDPSLLKSPMVLHNSCLVDHKLRTGEEYKPQKTP